jgi:pectate lyase
MEVTNYDGQMQVHEGNLEDCSSGDQGSTTALFEVADGGSISNVIMGTNVGDGIHCLGSCTIDNVWFPYVCDDAITALGSGTVTIRNSGFKNARDKTIQHNGSGTVVIDNVYVERAGKLYRSCGDGCDNYARTANISNVVAIAVDQVAGAGSNDTVTMENICVYRTAAICTTYEPGSDNEATDGVNGSNDGPSGACQFTASDIHALIDQTTGVAFATEALCGGPNGFKSGGTATACVSGFDQCLKMCMPGGYGFKQLTCTDGLYDETTGCAMPADPTAATNLAESRVSQATSTVTKNDNCSTQWDIGLDSSNTAKYCVCVEKPGYFDYDNWLAWDCQDPWW